MDFYCSDKRASSLGCFTSRFIESCGIMYITTEYLLYFPRYFSRKFAFCICKLRRPWHNFHGNFVVFLCLRATGQKNRSRVNV